MFIKILLISFVTYSYCSHYEESKIKIITKSGTLRTKIRLLKPLLQTTIARSKVLENKLADTFYYSRRKKLIGFDILFSYAWKNIKQKREELELLSKELDKDYNQIANLEKKITQERNYDLLNNLLNIVKFSEDRMQYSQKRQLEFSRMLTDINEINDEFRIRYMKTSNGFKNIKIGNNFSPLKNHYQMDFSFDNNINKNENTYFYGLNNDYYPNQEIYNEMDWSW